MSQTDYLYESDFMCLILCDPSILSLEVYIFSYINRNVLCFFIHFYKLRLVTSPIHFFAQPAQLVRFVHSRVLRESRFYGLNTTKLLIIVRLLWLKRRQLEVRGRLLEGRGCNSPH